MITPRFIYPNRNRTIVSIDQLRHYALIIENALETESIEVEKDEKSEKYKDSLIRTLNYRVNVIFPETHQKSIFILSYSLVEKELLQLAKMYQNSNKPQNKLDDFHDKGIDKVSRFFSHNFGIKIHSVKSWSKLKNYQKIRNHFVHVPNDTLHSKSKYLNGFRQIKSVKLTPMVFDYETYYTCKLLDNFLEELFDTLDTFFKELYDLLETYDNGYYPLGEENQ